MSEKTKADLLMERLDKLETEYKAGLSEIQTALKTLQPEKTTENHKNLQEVLDCPTCKPQLVAKLKPEIEKSYREKLKTLKEPVICKDCGEIVEREADECPTCHGKKANAIS